MKLVVELVVIIIVLLIFILFLLYKIINNSFKIYNVEIETAKNNLQKNLNKKYDISLKTIEFLNKVIVINEDALQDFLNVNLNNINIEQLNNTLIDVDKYIEEYLQKNEKLVNDKFYKEITKDLNKLDITINATKKYYNTKVNEYNKLIKSFPNNIVSKIKKYEPKNKLKEIKKSELKILK